MDDTGIIEHVPWQSDDVVEDQIDSDVEDEPEETVNCISHTTAMGDVRQVYYLVALSVRDNTIQHRCSSLIQGNCCKENVFFSETGNNDIIFCNDK